MVSTVHYTCRGTSKVVNEVFFSSNVSKKIVGKLVRWVARVLIPPTLLAPQFRAYAQ